VLDRALVYLIDVVFGLFTYALLLRFVMQLLRAPFRNPVGEAVIALTDWIVRPLRKVLPGFRGIDWASLFATYLFQVLWLLAYTLVFGGGFTFGATGIAYLLVAALVALFKASLWLLLIVVVAQALLSWVAPDGPAAGLLNALTFPFLRPIRRVLPPLGGRLDLSPLVVIVIVQLLQITLVPWLESAVTRAFI
jgi:YggT family protein